MAQTMRDMMAGHTKAEIICAHRGEVVRRLTVGADGSLNIDAITEAIRVSLDTPLVYEAWCMDRGSMLFAAPQTDPKESRTQMLKLCTEADVIRFDDGSERLVLPGPG